MSETTTLVVPRGRRRRPVRPGHSGRSTPAFARRRANLLYLPALLILAVFTLYPLANGVLISFTDWNGYSADRSFVGLANYLRLFTDVNVATALGNTFVYGVGSTLIQQVLGLGLALILDRAIRGRDLARAVIYLPVLVAPVVMGTMYYLLFSYGSGGLNDLVTALGGERVAWLAESSSAVAIIVIVNSLQFVGISMVIYLAGLQSIPTMYHEAARVDGATGWTMLRTITLPLLLPAFATSVTLNLIGGFKLFDVIRVMTGGGPGYSTESMSTLISRYYFDNQSAGYAAALGVALFVLIVAVTVLLNTVLNRRRWAMT